jgi:adenylate cyclase
VSHEPPAADNEEFWRRFLLEGDPREQAGRRVFRWLPHSPRCGLCLAPFAGPAAPVMRMLGKRPSQQNPAICNSCFDHMAESHGGAEIEMSLLFADVRGSTTIAEGMTSSEFRALLDRFYRAAADAVFGNHGAIDKFVGDEVVAYFVPAWVPGGHHARKAVDAATALLRLTGHRDTGTPWVPIGAGVHTGPAWIGAVGDATRTDFTALGDTVNTTSRLAAAAGPGEVLVSAAAAAAAGLDPGLARRTLELKGKSEPTEVVILTAARTDGARTTPAR